MIMPKAVQAAVRRDYTTELDPAEMKKVSLRYHREGDKRCIGI